MVIVDAARRRRLSLVKAGSEVITLTADVCEGSGGWFVQEKFNSMLST